MKKNLFLLLLTLIFVNDSYANITADNLINPVEKQKFFSHQPLNLVNNIDSMVGPKKALVEVGECLKYLKNGESFWNKYETEYSKVEGIGAKHIKIRPFIFVKGSEMWSLEENAKDIPFEAQTQFELTECPKEEFKLSEETLEILKKKQS